MQGNELWLLFQLGIENHMMILVGGKCHKNFCPTKKMS